MICLQVFVLCVFTSLFHVCTMYSADGQTTLTATVPDTITSWVLSAFAINPNVGLGIASERAEVSIMACVVVYKLLHKPIAKVIEMAKFRPLAPKFFNGF